MTQCVDSCGARANKRGRFITAEGVDGAGKSTQLAVIAEAIASKGIELVQTREPGGTVAAEKIRELLLKEEMTPRCELMLMFAARLENLERVILPALNAGKWVLSDRFTDASYAYQGAGRGLPESDIAALEAFVHPNLKPDLTFLFDIDTQEAQRRLTRAHDRFEQQEADFHRRVRAGYLKLAASESQRFRVIDASAPLEAVTQQVREVIDAWV